MYLSIGGGEFMKGLCSVLELFIIAMESLSRTFSDRGLPWELLNADDLVLLADTEDELKKSCKGGRVG